MLRAMRLAEYTHRNHYKDSAGHYRKAPEGEDRPAYFLHLTEVAWMLQDAGCNPTTVASGYLHDVIEDCEGWDRARLAKEIKSNEVAELVLWVTEPSKDSALSNKLEKSWEERNQGYFDQLQLAPDGAVSISCADKTSNLCDMNRLANLGYQPHEFTKRDHATQYKKFERLAALFESRVPAVLNSRYKLAFDHFRKNGKTTT